MNSFSLFNQAQMIFSSQTDRPKTDHSTKRRLLPFLRARPIFQREEEIPETEISEEMIQYVFRFACVNQPRLNILLIYQLHVITHIVENRTPTFSSPR